MSYVAPDLKQIEERLFSFFDNVPYDPGNFFYDYRANVAVLRELSTADDPQRHIDQFSNIVAAIVSSKDEIRERLAIKYSQFVEEPDGNTYIVPCTRKLAEDEFGIAWGNIELEMLVYKDALDKVKMYSRIKSRSDSEPSHPGVVSPYSDTSTANIQVCPIETSTEQHSSDDEWGCKLPDEALMRIYDELLIGGKYFVNRGMTPTEFVDWARDFDTCLWLGCDAAGAILVMEKLAPWFTNLHKESIALLGKVKTRQKTTIHKKYFARLSTAARYLRKDEEIRRELNAFFDEFYRLYKQYL